MKSATLLDKMRIALSKIGVTNGTSRPINTNDEHSNAAWEYYIATQLAKEAEARKERALTVCQALNVIPDFKANPLPAGTSKVLHADDVMVISVTTRKAATRFNSALFTERFKAKHPKLAAEIDALVAECTQPNATPHAISAALKE